MSSAVGIEVKAAIRKAVTWGTAAACGAGHGVLILPDSIKKSRTNLKDDSLGQYFAVDSDTGEIKAEGNIQAYLRYDSLDLLIAQVMGAAGTPTGTGPYTHVYDLADSLDGLFLTYCINNKVNIEEFAGLKLSGFTLTGSVGQPLKITFKGIAYDMVTNSVVNTLVTFANVTNPETANRVLYSQGVMRLNGQNGIALAAGDKITPKTFTLDFTRNMKGEYGLGTFNNIDEPTNDGPPTVTLSLEFPRYTADTYFMDWDANNKKKMDMTFTGAGGRSCKLEFPNLKIQEVDLPLAAGILKHPVKFDCLGATAAPTGMTGVTKPFRLTLVNNLATDPLA